jgi:hypothetical protein
MKADAKGDPNQPAWAAALAPLIADSKWIKMELSLGDAPAIGVALQAADDTSANGIVTAVGQGTQMLRDQGAQLKQAGPQLAAMGDALTSLADALKPKQDGSAVTMSVDGKTVGPIVSQILPMLMGAGGGGQPRPAGGGL